MLTAERLREVLSYNPETGAFTWLVSTSNRIRVGDVAGSVRPDGYRKICVDGRQYLAHRLAYLYVTGEWPAEYLDHINGNPGDDRWANLRSATGTQNSANKRKQRNNTSGFKGVLRHAARKKQWQARIGINGHGKCLGYFDTPENAHAAYVAAAVKRFGEFARAA
jgi:hypothetical protein